ncbi:MAG: radical SAM protein [Nanoarchaeota archaeon]
MKQKIFLIYPRLKLQVYSLWPPQGIVLLATILKKEGYDVHIIDSSFDNSQSKIKTIIKNEKPTLVCVSISTDLFNESKEIVSFAKKQSIKTFAGGPYVSLEPFFVMDQIPDLDFALTINNEKIFLESIKIILSNNSPEKLSGVVFRKNNQLKLNDCKDLPVNLNSLPMIDYSLLPTIKQYFGIGTATIMGSRGCPFDCTFCQPVLKKIHGEKPRLKDPKNIIEEINYLNKFYNIKEFYFLDDTFGFNKQWLRKLVLQIEKHKLNQKIKFLVNSRVDLFDKEFISLLKRMNCKLVSFGVESGSQKILDSLNKRTTILQIINAFKLCQINQINTHANFMMNCPGETKETLKETRELIKKIKPTILYLSFLTPYPGTYLYETCLNNNTLNLRCSKDFNCRSYSKSVLPVKNSSLTLKDFVNFRKTILRRRKPLLFYNIFIDLIKDLFEALKHHEVKLFFYKYIFRLKVFIYSQNYFG